jgi:hypothetical protein
VGPTAGGRRSRELIEAALRCDAPALMKDYVEDLVPPVMSGCSPNPLRTHSWRADLS